MLKQKQNIATTLLLLVWAAMFCFSVSVTLHKQPAKATYIYSSAFENNEKLTSEEKSHPVAWTEQSNTQVVSSHVESYPHLFTTVFQLTRPQTSYVGKKTVKALLAFASATIRFRILPNAP